MVKELNADEESFSPYGQILASAKASLGARTCISFSHVCRLDNSVVHNLTKHARHVKGFSVNRGCSPHTYSLLFFFFKKKTKKQKTKNKKKTLDLDTIMFFYRQEQVLLPSALFSAHPFVI